MGDQLSFAERFGREPAMLVRAPGRVNLIGEHTDYNLGYVLPTAIDKYTKLAAAPRTDHRLNIYSENMGESIEIDLQAHLALVGNSGHWANYARGAAWWLRDHQYAPVGADILIWGDLPISAGLSSSASLLMGLLAALSSLSGWSIPPLNMAKATQTIESEFVGVPTGMMDQMAIGLSQPDAALLIDCRSLSTTDVPLNLDAHGLALVVVDSGISRDLASSAYGKRRKECESAVGALRVITYNLEIQSLRDVDSKMLSKYGGKLYHTLYKRARHVVTENERVLQTISALSLSDFEQVGRLMNESHQSLCNDFEVSNPFMDKLVELAQKEDGVLGARLTGAGFGGCTVNLVRTDAIRNITRNVVRQYKEETSLGAKAYVVKAAGGLEVQQL